MLVALSVAIGVVALALLVRWIEPRLAFFPFTGEDVTPRQFGVGYDAITLETADGEKLRAWIMTAPSARARVVYFHGNGGNLSNWTPILTGIVRRGFSVCAIDYRGYGMSTGHPTERGLYRDVDAAIAHAWTDAANGVPLVYWGRSLGGSMAAYAATVRRPDGLILESTFPDARGAVRGSPILSALALLASYRFPAAEFVNRTNMPVLQLHGDRDTVIPIAAGRVLFARMREPKTFVVIAGADHNDAVPPDAAAYWNAIDSFVRSLPSTSH